MNAFLAIGLFYMAEHQNMIEGLKQRALDKYKAALLMPRKKKKVAKKSALLLYSIACHGEELLSFK